MSLSRLLLMNSLVCVAVGCVSDDVPLPLSGGEPSAAAEAAAVTRSTLFEVVPGESIGPVTVGTSHTELLETLGEPAAQFSFQRVITYRYPGIGLEVVLTSSEATEASDDARVCSVGTLPGAPLTGELQHGLTREAIEAQLGTPTVEERDVAHFTRAGVAVKFDADERAVGFAVWPGYEPRVVPPEMLPAQTTMPDTGPVEASGSAVRYEIDGELYEVVDVHLHTGKAASQQPDGVAFLLSQLPAPALMNFPATSDLVLDPYAEHVGIKEHLSAAGVAHGVLLAAYTHHTVGYAENRLIEALLADPRNVNADGSRWAWGMASINFDDFDAPGVAESRLAALDSYFAERPDLFIGIKLAHAHQAVAFDDPTFLGVYDIAAARGVPLLLHTGFSPFPHAMTEAHYYDPHSLTAVVEAYDGDHGAPRVDFVLAHVGQGDARAIEHSLQLAASHDNVWLELSAITRPLLIGEDGEDVDDPTPMHTYVLSEIKARGLIDRAIYATDGPQYFGKAQSYLHQLVTAMKALDYTREDLTAVLSGNFYDCFHPPQG